MDRLKDLFQNILIIVPVFTITIQYTNVSTHQCKFHFLLWSFHLGTDRCTYSHHGCFCKVDQACIHSACIHLHLIKKKKKAKKARMEMNIVPYVQFLMFSS